MLTHVPIAAPDSSIIGARVSIRVHDEEPGKFRDLLGHLVDLSHVRDKNGVVKEFDPSAIVAWKVVNQ
jgi:hypothetical protein